MRMYCPDCKKMTKCKVVDYDAMLELGLNIDYDGKRVRVENVDEYKGYHTSIGGINCYLRCRWCEECRETFWTAELSKEHVYELTKLKNENAELRERIQCLENAVANFVGAANLSFANTAKIPELQAKRKELAKRLYDDYHLEVQDIQEESDSNTLRHKFVFPDSPVILDECMYQKLGYDGPVKKEVLEKLAEDPDVSQKLRDLAKLVIEYRRLDKKIKEFVDR